VTLHRILRVRPLSFLAKLALSFACLSFVAITVAGMLLAAFNHRRAVDSLRDKATRYARLIEPQLKPVVAFNDGLTAHEVFDSFSADHDVSGMAVYAAGGALINGSGVFPDHLSGQAPGLPTVGHVVVLAPVVSPEGPTGRLYVSLTTAAIDKDLQRSSLTAVTTAVMALFLSLAIGTLLSRAVTLRVRRLADAANKIAGGDLDQPDIDPGSDDEIGHLARAFNSMVGQLRRQFADRALMAATEQARLEALVTTRTRELEENQEQYRHFAESTNAIPFTYVPRLMCFSYVGPQAEKRLGFPPDVWKAPGFLEALLPPEQVASVRERLDAPSPDGEFDFECTARCADGRNLQLKWVVTSGESKGERWLHGLILDITAQRQLEQELAQSQKLESVGRLASGVAHEINTPVQFVSDSTHFLKSATADLLNVVGKLQAVRDAVVAGQPYSDALADATLAEEDAELEYLVTQMPKAVDRCLDGLGRVATIVRSMKEFAHPDSRDMVSVDLNRAVESTLTIARSEYKYVADLETDFGELPPVICHVGDVNQVVLNIVVNAAQAIEDVVKGSGRKGLIKVSTRSDGDAVIVAIRDTGGGIPARVADRVFDPFFTTKEVGKGTGQGLSMARRVIVDRHNGDLRFETEPGAGTTFFIRLPVNGLPRSADADASRAAFVAGS
jgi:signal transduction histidine kinase